MRAKQKDQERQQVLAGKTPTPPSTNHGFLKTTDAWQDRFFKPQPPTILDYFLRSSPQTTMSGGQADAEKEKVSPMPV